jgi:hypothetical protein
MTQRRTRQHFFVVAAEVDLDTKEVFYTIDKNQADHRFGKTIWDPEIGNWLPISGSEQPLELMFENAEIHSALSMQLALMNISLPSETTS